MNLRGRPQLLNALPHQPPAFQHGAGNLLRYKSGPAHQSVRLPAPPFGLLQSIRVRRALTSQGTGLFAQIPRPLRQLPRLPQQIRRVHRQLNSPVNRIQSGQTQLIGPANAGAGHPQSLGQRIVNIRFPWRRQRSHNGQSPLGIRPPPRRAYPR